jgi:hypothetical protein
MAVESVRIGDGWAGVDISASGLDESFYSCCSSHDRGVVFIDVETSGYDTESTNALNAGCYVVLYQGYYSPYWSDPSYGTSRGNYAMSAAQTVGYPAGCTIYLDVEECDSVSSSTIIDWINNWATVITGAGYEAGIYVGCNQPLNSEQLYADLPNVNHYWETCSTDCQVPVDTRGYQVFQTDCEVSLCGQSVDEDTFQPDNLGGATYGMHQT